MDFKIKIIQSENKVRKHFGSTRTELKDKTEIGFVPNRLGADNSIFRKVIVNYDYNLQVSPEGYYVVVLDREIETSSGVENDFFSGGTFLIGETLREVKKTKKIKAQVSSSFLSYKTLKSYAMPFLNWKRFVVDSRLLDI
ncbi:hypothetical protein [Flavobacterium sp. CSZ]|uniref:hypothetical protein n=1 Tax=Flavobacterium sp. CSZ TaxID=2783791 RepID=UPI00188ACFB9|nr:hypothetical protein [Flavobacterium sp. CSZ]MBF4485055.1 hypothetical protein [Flavobacterium sp. CSZ]